MSVFREYVFFQPQWSNLWTHVMDIFPSRGLTANWKCGNNILLSRGGNLWFMIYDKVIFNSWLLLFEHCYVVLGLMFYGITYWYKYELKLMQAMLPVPVNFSREFCLTDCLKSSSSSSSSPFSSSYFFLFLFFFIKDLCFSHGYFSPWKTKQLLFTSNSHDLNRVCSHFHRTSAAVSVLWFAPSW